MEEVNPYQNEVTYTDEQLAADIRLELQRLEEHKAYLTEMLAQLDEREQSRQLFIDLAYEG